MKRVFAGTHRVRGGREKPGPPIAGEILRRLGVEEGKITAVKELIAYHHTPGKINTKEFACLRDADFIVNLPEVAPRLVSEKLRFLIDNRFMTSEGKRTARGIFLESSRS